MAGVRTIGPKRAWNREALLEMGAALSADRRRSRRRAGKISGDAGDSTTERGSRTAITRKWQDRCSTARPRIFRIDRKKPDRCVWAERSLRHPFDNSQFVGGEDRCARSQHFDSESCSPRPLVVVRALRVKLRRRDRRSADPSRRWNPSSRFARSGSALARDDLPAHNHLRTRRRYSS